MSRYSASSNKYRSHFGQTSLEPQSFLISIGCSLSQFQHLKVRLGAWFSNPYILSILFSLFILFLSLTRYMVSHFSTKVKLYFKLYLACAVAPPRLQPLSRSLRGFPVLRRAGGVARNGGESRLMSFCFSFFITKLKPHKRLLQRPKGRRKQLLIFQQSSFDFRISLVLVFRISSFPS